MPKNSNILMVRHAEKPDSGKDLSVTGQERAHAYAVYFQNYVLNGTLLKLNYIFATADSSQSQRPRLTMEPLAKAMGMEINARYQENDYQKVADDILQNSKYHHSNILICWHHGEILELAAALGVDANKLPPESHWPSPPWPGEVFGWLLRVCYDADGNVIPSQTVCINQFSAVKPRHSQNQRTSNAVASPAMIVDGGVGSAEHHLLDEIVGQEIMREAEFDFGGVVQLGQFFIR